MNILQSIGHRAIRRRLPARALVVVAALLGVLALEVGTGRAALLRLRNECTGRGAVVTLGDVAEIFAADASQAKALAAIELFPAPAAPRQRFLRLRELQDLLLLRGVNLAEHQFSGSSQVTISGRGEPPESKPERPLSSSAATAANRRVVQSAVQYLQQCVSAPVPWIVEVELDPARARLVADPGRTISISGGAPPWTGSQRFEVTVHGPEGAVRFPLDAQVTTSPAVVVAARSLPRGAVIRPTDVVLQQGGPQAAPSDVFRAIDEVVGKETTCAIPKDKVLQQESVRPALLVRRGDAVTVYARSPGICIRTVGRARDNGSLGELVAVESLQDRSTYFARVSNVREVEIYARSAKAERESLSGLPPAVKR
jgi:flagella basal body P-ring formation protein FlgA